jgi:hypothetical protein
MLVNINFDNNALPSIGLDTSFLGYGDANALSYSTKLRWVFNLIFESILAGEEKLYNSHAGFFFTSLKINS